MAQRTIWHTAIVTAWWVAEAGCGGATTSNGDASDSGAVDRCSAVDAWWCGPDANLFDAHEAGGRAGDGSVGTDETCGVANDCVNPPTDHCEDQHVLLSYEMASCVRGRCAWQEIEIVCPAACQADYCVTAK